MYARRLCLTIAIALTVVSTPALVASAADDGAALVSQCAARDWRTYVNYKLKLLDANAVGSYCVPLPENAGRYQYEFLAFIQHEPPDLHNVAAAIAEAEYFGLAYTCQPRAISPVSRQHPIIQLRIRGFGTIS